MRFDLGTLDSGERSLPFGLLVLHNLFLLNSSGSILLYYITPFLNSAQVQNVTNIKNILSGTESDRKREVKDNMVYLGDFLIDVDSITIVLESYRSNHLPKRPRVIMKGEISNANHIIYDWAATIQNQQNKYAPSEDSDQSGHPPSLIRVFAIRMKKAWFCHVAAHVLSAPSSCGTFWDIQV